MTEILWSFASRSQVSCSSSNDFYWVTDALNLYWKELPGNKWILYVPNTGHDLLRPNPESFNRLINGLAGFARQQMSGKAMPELRWQHEEKGDHLRLVRVIFDDQ